MNDKIMRFYVPLGKRRELCYNVGYFGELSRGEQKRLEIFFKAKPTERVYHSSRLKGDAIEIGTLPSRETSFSSQAVDLFRDCGFTKIYRVEVSERVITQNPEEHIKKHCDVMTECVYTKPLETFEVERPADPLIIVPTQGDIGLIHKANEEYRMGMDQADVEHFWRVFNEKIKRDATAAEMHSIREWISNHSRHRDFNAQIIIDGKVMPHTLMQLVKKPNQLYPGNNVVAFHDNASAIYGGTGLLFTPERPGWPTRFVETRVLIHPTITVETHCYPTEIAAWYGAETGIGGDNRDGNAIGRGGSHLYSIAGFSMGNLWIPGYVQRWERMAPAFNSEKFESPLTIALDAPGGTWDYQNKYGVPTLQGFFRTVEMVTANGEHYAYYKPIMMAGMVGWMLDIHKAKDDAVRGMLVCAIGGPAYKIGFGGGSGSSVGTDEKNSIRDKTAVQRGNAGMGHLTWRAIRLCVEMGILNPIRAIHDQGAAGVINVLTELIEKSGGKIYLRRINVGDRTMIVIELLLCEYQERYGLLINEEDLPILERICKREGCPLEVLGEVTGDGMIVFYDEETEINHINLPIKEILQNLPQRVIRDEAPAYLGAPIEIPKDLTVDEAIKEVLKLPAVACKDFLVHHTDTSIGGLRVVGQACGPLFLPLSDFAMSSIDFEGSFGVVTAIGEKPLMMMLNPQAGARMTATEMFLNASSVRHTGDVDIKCSINWMWAAKGIRGGIAKEYIAMESLTDFMIAFKTGGNGGKDSNSLFTLVDGKLIKSSETLVLTGLVRADDITKYVSPDIKMPGKSKLMLIDPVRGKCRLGGSAFLQTLGQLGDVCPDIDPVKLRRAIRAEHVLMDENLILASHDRTGDGGLIICILEMLFAGDCGANIQLNGENIYSTLFAEEAGKVIEYLPEHEKEIIRILRNYNTPYQVIGETLERKFVNLYFNNCSRHYWSVVELRQQWREFSYQMEKLQINPECAEADYNNRREPKKPPYLLTFKPKATPKKVLHRKRKPKIAVLRGKVTTGDRELSRVFYEAGFEVKDAHLSDFKNGEINLEEFQGLMVAPGFSHEDVFGAGKGIAVQILYDPRLKKQFKDFRDRPDTFFLGPCNGSQVGARIGFAPFEKLDEMIQPLFLRNESGAFQSNPVVLQVNNSPSIFFKGMEGSRLPSWVAHGEGQVWFPDKKLIAWVEENKLVSLVYVDDSGQPTTKYPFNPNGSIKGWAGFCDQTGRFNVMMPHPIDRSFKMWQWPWWPEQFKRLKAAPWIQAAQNAREWAEQWL